jgi:hypothetical protein
MSIPKRIRYLIDNPKQAIGLQVFKPSGKPFKSSERINTVKCLTTNPHTGRVAFSFIEDDSIVDVIQCELYKGEKHEN